MPLEYLFISVGAIKMSPSGVTELAWADVPLKKASRSLRKSEISLEVVGINCSVCLLLSVKKCFFCRGNQLDDRENKRKSASDLDAF